MNKKSYFMSVLIILLCACGDGKKEQKEQVRCIEIISPEMLGESSVKHYTGMVKEAAQVSVAFKTAGQLSKIMVKEGDYVRDGQLIATLDDSDYLLALEAVKSQYRQLKDEVERLKTLHEGKALSGNDYEKAVSGLEQVEVNLQVYQNKVKYTNLYAPTSGFVEKVNFERSEMVDAGTPVLTLLADGGKEVEVALPLSLYQQREQMVQSTATIGGKTYLLRLQSIVPKADNTQLYRAIFAIEKADDSVTSGMNANVSIGLDTAQNVTLTLPLHAIFQHEGKSCVWIVNADSTISRQSVETGSVTADGRIAISAGLNGNEQIVKAGVTHLHDGEHVRIAIHKSKTNVGNQL